MIYSMKQTCACQETTFSGGGDGEYFLMTCDRCGAPMRLIPLSFCERVKHRWLFGVWYPLQRLAGRGIN